MYSPNPLYQYSSMCSPARARVASRAMQRGGEDAGGRVQASLRSWHNHHQADMRIGQRRAGPNKRLGAIQTCRGMLLEPRRPSPTQARSPLRGCLCREKRWFHRRESLSGSTAPRAGSQEERAEGALLQTRAEATKAAADTDAARREAAENKRRCLELERELAQSAARAVVKTQKST